MYSSFSISRPSNAKDPRSHSRPDKARGYKRIREPSPEQLPADEDEDEDEYQQNYSSSSPQHYSQHYNHRNLGGYQSEEYESPVDEPVPSPPRKQTGHSKPHREQAREYGSHTSREQERRTRPAQVPRDRHDNREQKETTTHPSSKRSHQSSIQESRKGKKRGSDGTYLEFCLAVDWMEILLNFFFHKCHICCVKYRKKYRIERFDNTIFDSGCFQAGKKETSQSMNMMMMMMKKKRIPLKLLQCLLNPF